MQNNRWLPYLLLFKRLGIALLLFSVSRIVFAFFNPVTVENSGVTPFLYGIRFDLSAIAILFSPFILLHIFLTKIFYHPVYQKITSFVFHFLCSIGLLFNYIDCVWFPFTHKRTTTDFFQLIKTGEDTGNNLGQYIFDYWYMVLIWFLTVLLGIWLYRKTLQSIKHKELPHWMLRIIAFPILSGFFIIAARGGFQYKPMSVQAAAGMTKPESIPLVLNTPFTLIKSLRDTPLPSQKFYKDEDADRIFNPHKQTNPIIEFSKENVVIIVLESFSKEFIGIYNNGKGYTPFLDSLAVNSLNCTNAYANGKRSIEGIPAIAAALPALMDEPFITSAWNANRINSLASILKPYGYSSAFFHGGNNGTMGFDNFSKLLGYDHYYGKNDYDGNASDYDGHWGIFDEPYYYFMIRKINAIKGPFTTLFFSLSSHHPYTIPPPYQGKFPKGTMQIHESIGYADNALKLFFIEAAKQPWFKNTLFVITADHTGPSQNSDYETRTGIYKIPIIYYRPGNTLAGKMSEVTQQTDILPSVLSLLNYKGKFSSFGNSIFDTAATHAAINYQNNSWQLITNNYSLLFDGNETSGLYDLKKDNHMQNNLFIELSDTVKRYEPYLKVMLQQFRQSLTHNNYIQP